MIYECPPCPKDAVCQTCPLPYIVISEKNKEIQYPDQMTSTELRVNTSYKSGLELGKKYRLTITVQTYKMFSAKHNEMEVTEFAPVQGHAPKLKPSK